MPGVRYSTSGSCGEGLVDYNVGLMALGQLDCQYNFPKLARLALVRCIFSEKFSMARGVILYFLEFRISCLRSFTQSNSPFVQSITSLKCVRIPGRDYLHDSAQQSARI